MGRDGRHIYLWIHMCDVQRERGGVIRGVWSQWEGDGHGICRIPVFTLYGFTSVIKEDNENSFSTYWHMISNMLLVKYSLENFLYIKNWKSTSKTFYSGQILSSNEDLQYIHYDFWKKWSNIASIYDFNALFCWVSCCNSSLSCDSPVLNQWTNSKVWFICIVPQGIFNLLRCKNK